MLALQARRCFRIAGDQRSLMKSMLFQMVFGFAILLPLKLDAIDGTISITEIKIHQGSMSVRFKGYLGRLDRIYILDLIRPDTMSNADWMSLQKDLAANLGKTVKIDIPSKRFGSRGPVLTIFDTTTIKMIEEK